MPLSEDVKPYLTEAQQQQIRDNEGKWEITEVAMDTVSPYVDQLDTYASQLADCTRVIIAGGQTGFCMPVAEVQWSGDEKQQWGGLLPVAEKPQVTWEEESAGHIQTVSWQQIAVPVLAVFLLAAVIILQKRKSC